MVLIVEKLTEYVLEGLSFEAICEKIREYTKKTGLLFIIGLLILLTEKQ